MRSLLLNCTLKDTTLCPTYRKPYQLLRDALQMKERGERVDDVRTASEQAWGVFLRAFTRWCASEEARALLVKNQQRVMVSGS